MGSPSLAVATIPERPVAVEAVFESDTGLPSSVHVRSAMLPFVSVAATMTDAGADVKQPLLPLGCCVKPMMGGVVSDGTSGVRREARTAPQQSKPSARPSAPICPLL